MKERMNQLFKDKLFLVMLVLALLTLVAAAGVVTVQKEKEEPLQYLAENETKELELETKIAVAGESNAVKESTEAEISGQTQVMTNETAVQEKSDAVTPAASGQEATTSLVLNFSDSSKMMWPIVGNVVLDYSMDTTIYFPTLDQYKCNPAIVIQGEVSDPVYAPANARVLEISYNEEIGNYVFLDLGNNYSVICGQLKEIKAVQGEYLEKGQIMGYIAEPTKYYSIEGSNLYLQVMEENYLLDPLDYLE